MNQEDDNRRLLLAAALCLGVLGGWQLMFSKPPQDPGPSAEDQAVVSATVAATGTSSVGKTDGVQSVTTSTASGTLDIVRAEPQRSRFEGSVQVDGRDIRYEVALTNVGGGLDGFELPTFFERDEDNRRTDEPIRLADPVQGTDRGPDGQMGGLLFGEGTTFTVGKRPVYEVEEKADGVVYRLRTPEGVVVEREWTVSRESGLLEGAVTVRNESAQPQSHVLQWVTALEAPASIKEGGGWLANFGAPPDHLQGLCWTDGSVKREGWKDLQKEPERYAEDVRWVAVDRQYFVGALVLRDRTEASCRLDAEGERVSAMAELSPVRLVPGEERRHKFTMFLGVKKPDLLTLANAELESAVDYTILGLNLAPLCAFLLWILGIFHDLTGSWGLGIIGLTVLVKGVLFPLTQKQGKSMRAMSALKPEMDAIREKFSGDQQRQSEELMRLYRKHNVNPAGGCLPLLLQMPIFFALNKAMWVSVDLYQEPFLWMSDLTIRDPYWILPVFLMVVMFVQQRMLPSTMDPAQQKVFQYVMPLVFGSMMAALPAGLVVYILVNTLLTIVQQHFINRSIGPPAPAPAS
ncbi:MAG: membrane protein insertase YidC [Myxococcota bacterium]